MLKDVDDINSNGVAVSSDESQNNVPKVEDNNKNESASSDGHRHHHSSHHSSHHHHSHNGHHSHHSSRGSHHGHSKRRRRRRRSSRNSDGTKKDSKFKLFLKKYRSVIINVFACLICVILLILLALSHDNKDEQKNNTDVNITNNSIVIESSIYTDEIPLVPASILAYMDESNIKDAKTIFNEHGGNKTSQGIGLPVKYYYRVSGIPSGVSVQSAKLLVSQNEDMTEALSYNVDVDAKSIDIYHLIPGTKYYYELQITLSTGNTVKTSGDFPTKQSPRILNIEGAVNVRDIGGWKAADEKTIKYGLLYRGSELDGSVEPSYLATERGLHDMISVLGIRYDMDLRSESDRKVNALGANVAYKNYNASMYAAALNKENSANLKDIFADLADPDKYPIYLHCTYGRDRTGTICYLLEGLLGVKDADLKRDYELTVFGGLGTASADFAVFVDRINQLEGNTTSEKIEGYLLSIGVTAEEIASIREIFLG